MKFNSIGILLGIHFAVKLMKNIKNGGKLMSLMEKDVVLTTDEATEYLKISKRDHRLLSLQPGRPPVGHSPVTGVAGGDLAAEHKF